MTTETAIDQLAVDTLRFLSVDMVEAANSGHPGLPLGAAPMAYALWNKRLRFNPEDPTWFNRDRFVLSAGHGSALLYSLLHVFGYDLPLDELKRFRQWESATPGHPEFGETPGVEATTGPLGQGLGNAVGMAIAEAWLAARYNLDDLKIIDHHTFVLVSDGDLMEGIGQEAASLAGHLKLSKLIALYDSNRISLDGPCDLSFSEDTAAKFTAMGWHVQTVADGNDVAAIEQAIRNAETTDQPSLIEVKTVIGFGSPKAGSSASHGAPLGAEATQKTKENLGWTATEPFFVPSEVAELAGKAKERGSALQAEWNEKFAAYAERAPELHAEISSILSCDLPEDWDAGLTNATFTGEVATRNAGKTALNAVAKTIPWIVGGAADLSGSTKTSFDGSPAFSATDHAGRNIFYGVREHAMGAIVNGLCYHGLLGLGSTFLVFSDYMRGAMRISALAELPALYVFTHDSVFVGEDGPTHEPIEQIMSLRLVPGLDVYRPADAYETVEAFRSYLEHASPAVIILSRQELPVLTEYVEEIRAGFPQGGYVLRDAEDEPDVVIIATGSEVSLALKVADALNEQEELQARVVSMPCWDLFLAQEQDVIDSVLPPDAPRVSIEAGVAQGWERFVGLDGMSIGIDEFGASAPGERVYSELGFSVEAVVTRIVDFLER